MWFFPALLSAILSAVSVIYNKHALKHVNASVLTLALSTLNLPLLLIAVLISPPPLSIKPLFYLAAAGSGCLFIISKTLSLSAIKHSQLSQIIPLTSIGVIFTYLFGVIFLAEKISRQGIVGLLLISSGTYILNVNKSNISLLSPLKVLFQNRSPKIYLAATLIGSFLSILDKTALNHIDPSNPALLLLSQNVVISLGIILFVKNRQSSWLDQIAHHFRSLFIASVIYGAFVLSTFIGFSQGPVALTVALINTRILLILALSYLLYQDKPSKLILIGTIITLIGVVLIKSF